MYCNSVVTLVLNICCDCCNFFFFFNDTATTEIYTLSLHDALPIWTRTPPGWLRLWPTAVAATCPDRKSTRLNSSHGYISYAVFCLKKKKNYNCLVIISDLNLTTLKRSPDHQYH